MRLQTAETPKLKAAGRGELLPQVYRTSRALLLGGRSSGDDVAQLLAIIGARWTGALRTRA